MDSQPNAGASICVELGCGGSKLHSDSIGIDIEWHDGVDIVGDALTELKKFDASSVVHIVAHHFLEHTNYVQDIFSEAERVLVPGGVFEGSVPHFSNPFYYSDPTHQTHFGLYTFKYLASCSNLKRPIPDYVKTGLLVEDLRFGFSSYPPRYVRHAFKKIVGFLVNRSWYFKELYEECFCWLIPCYEIRFRLVKQKQAVGFPSEDG